MLSRSSLTLRWWSREVNRSYFLSCGKPKSWARNPLRGSVAFLSLGLEARDTQQPGAMRSRTTRAKLLTLLGGTLIALSVLGFIRGFVPFQVARVENPSALWKLAGVGLTHWSS